MSAAEFSLHDSALTALKQAKATYESLSEALSAEIHRATGLQDDTPDGAKNRLNLILAHQKALLTVLDFVARVEKKIADREGRRQGEIDLVAARREIMGKLARLAGRGGDAILS